MFDLPFHIQATHRNLLVNKSVQLALQSSNSPEQNPGFHVKDYSDGNLMDNLWNWC